MAKKIEISKEDLKHTMAMAMAMANTKILMGLIEDGTFDIKYHEDFLLANMLTSFGAEMCSEMIKKLFGEDN